jgi:hypothetical protein
VEVAVGVHQAALVEVVEVEVIFQQEVLVVQQ